ncbi:MAG TPA: outer membrane beta-barrel protein [Vicinamibacteria bacterium]
MTRHLIPTLALAVLLAAPLAHAQEQASLSLGAGYVAPNDVDSTFWVTANYRFRLGDRLLLEPEVGYWEKGDDVPGVDVSIEDLNFGLNAILPLGSARDTGLSPWVGAGLGLHRLKGVVDLDDDDDDAFDETETKLGIHLLGGFDYGLTDTLALYAAARFDIVSDLNQFKVYGGVRYRF